DSLQRVLGFDVLCGDRAHRYLPLPACEIGEHAITVPSALVLLRQELDFYRERGRSLTAVRGFPVRREGRSLGTLVDLVFAPSGELLELLLGTDEGEATAEPGPKLLVGPDALQPAVYPFSGYVAMRSDTGTGRASAISDAAGVALR